MKNCICKAEKLESNYFYHGELISHVLDKKFWEFKKDFD